jgi:hypothetical protein
VDQLTVSNQALVTENEQLKGTRAQEPKRPMIMSRIAWFRLISGLCLLALGSIDFCLDLSDGQVVSLWLFFFVLGGFILLHFSIDRALARLSTRSANTTESVWPKSYFDTTRTIVEWLIIASGVLIGLINTGTVTGITKLGVAVLSASIVLGVLYIIVLVAGLKKETDTEVVLEAPTHEFAGFLLNLTWWAFVAGVIAIAISVVQR